MAFGGTTWEDLQTALRVDSLRRRSIWSPASVSFLTSVLREKRLILPGVGSEMRDRITFKRLAARA